MQATSAPDNETEAALTAAIRGISGHKTMFVIAHRQASLAGCDAVVSI